MATSNKTAPAAKTPASPVAPVLPQAPAQAVRTQARAPQGGPLYVLAKGLPAVAPNSHRAYALAVAAHVQAANPKGFTLAALRAALVANPLPAAHPQRNVAPPRHGWAKHNMPTWGAGQGWWVQA
jgi:hypothetical protein